MARVIDSIRWLKASIDRVNVDPLSDNIQRNAGSEEDLAPHQDKHAPNSTTIEIEKTSRAIPMPASSTGPT